eukprot:m.28518 g.28518  ORF g.28518 m.28518 type:complete len:185 (+) comp30826_c1_seq3:329-883(+)
MGSETTSRREWADAIKLPCTCRGLQSLAGGAFANVPTFPCLVLLQSSMVSVQLACVVGLVCRWLSLQSVASTSSDSSESGEEIHVKNGGEGNGEGGLELQPTSCELPANLQIPESPSNWSEHHVKVFLEWFKSAHETTSLDLSPFEEMNGMQLTSLSEDDLMELAPFVGDLIYNFFHAEDDEDE